PIEKNAGATAGTTLTASDGSTTVTIPGSAYTAPTTDLGTDWLVLRIDPSALPTNPPTGFKAAGNVTDVTTTWAIGHTQLHQFDVPLSIVMANAGGAAVVPATLDDSGWRVIRHVPVDGSLPADWSDGFYTAADGIH